MARCSFSCPTQLDVLENLGSGPKILKNSIINNLKSETGLGISLLDQLLSRHIRMALKSQKAPQSYRLLVQPYGVLLLFQRLSWKQIAEQLHTTIYLKLNSSQRALYSTDRMCKNQANLCQGLFPALNCLFCYSIRFQARKQDLPRHPFA